MRHSTFPLAFLAAAAIAGCNRPPHYDLILRGGTIYDGSGGPPQPGALALMGDSIAAVGDLGESMLKRQPTEGEMAERLVEESFAKYPQYGRMDPKMYMGGVTVLRPRRVLAWTSFTENATRFRFE